MVFNITNIDVKCNEGYSCKKSSDWDGTVIYFFFSGWGLKAPHQTLLSGDSFAIFFSIGG